MMDYTAVQVVAARPRKVIAASGWGGAALNNVPDDILNDPELKLAQEVLPDNYNLEISKVTWKRENTSSTFYIDRSSGGYAETASRE